MSMWEIDNLLTKSITLIQTSNISVVDKKHSIWNLEQLPEVYKFDAGGFTKQETDTSFQYKKKHPFELGVIIVDLAVKENNKGLIYDWSAFLLNYYHEYFLETDTLEALKTNYLQKIKLAYASQNFDTYKPTHASLTMYSKGNEWFSEAQNALIQWFCN